MRKRKRSCEWENNKKKKGTRNNSRISGKELTWKEKEIDLGNKWKCAPTPQAKG